MPPMAPLIVVLPVPATVSVFAPRVTPPLAVASRVEPLLLVQIWEPLKVTVPASVTTPVPELTVNPPVPPVKLLMVVAPVPAIVSKLVPLLTVVPVPPTASGLPLLLVQV